MASPKSTTSWRTYTSFEMTEREDDALEVKHVAVELESEDSSSECSVGSLRTNSTFVSPFRNAATRLIVLVQTHGANGA